MSVERHREGTAADDHLGVHDRVLDHTRIEAEVGGRELLAVVETEFTVDVVREVRGQGRITERDVDRVGVVRHRHELGDVRLAGVAAVEEADVQIVVGIPDDLGVRRPVEHGEGGVDLVAGPGSSIVSRGGTQAGTDLCTEIVTLIEEVDTYALVHVIVQDAVGIAGIEHFTTGDVVVLLR